MKVIEHFKPVILVGDSPFDISVLKSLPKEWPIYAADGGGNILFKNKLKVQSIIGDLDSLDKSYIENKVPTIHINDQNTTDLQKCLNYIKASFLIGFGFLDRRIDHTLATCSAVCKKHFAKKIILVGKYDILIWSKESWGCSLPINTRVSIWPLGNQRFIESKGLKWPLDNLEMSPDGLIGTSNQTVKNKIFIKVDHGYRSKYVTLVPSKHLSQIIKIFKN